MRVATFPTEEASSLTLLYRVTNSDSGGDGNDDDVVTVVAIRIVAMVVKYAEAGVDANVSAMLHNSSLFSGYQSRLFPDGNTTRRSSKVSSSSGTLRHATVRELAQ
jgi:hypothetical protein